jgi:ribokinase
VAERRNAITVIGSANMDVVGRVPRLPREGETVLGTTLMHSPGGKGANQAVAAARAGSEVYFVGRIGSDEYADPLRQSLESAGVSLTYLRVDAGYPTGVALIMVDDEGNNLIAVLPGANGQVSVDDVDAARDAIGRSAVVVLQLEIPLDTVMHAATVAREMGARVVLNPAPAQALKPELLQMVDVIVPNQEEVGRLSGLGAPTDPAGAARVLLGAGPGAVIVTLGSLGATVVTREGETAVPAMRARAVDTTGAGDAFVGNLAHSLAEGMSLREATRFAGAAASLSVQKEGAQPAMPALSETEVLLRENS